MNSQELAELLFPHIHRTREEYEKLYPPRRLPAGAVVTRLGPSPTGFIHLGNLYGAFVDERMAARSGGIFYLRIEDTDDKRQVEGAVEVILDALRSFGICFAEGADKTGGTGAYGPYFQSRRADIYQCYAKELVARKLAYPCFLTEEEITAIREQQEALKENPGIYGRWAVNRDLEPEEAARRIRRGDPYVIRLRSQGRPPQPAERADAAADDTAASIRTEPAGIPQPASGVIRMNDGIRGLLEMPENHQDVVILKANGIPTYHFAHVVDDHLMRTTHVVRGAEWLPSLPIHVELFQLLGFPIPVYCHTAQLMKLDESGNRRKLSKRLDPELSLDYYRSEGYHPRAVREYLMTILNSNFEEWRMEHPHLPLEEFPFSVERMSSSGALFDLNKLRDISKDVLLRIPGAELAGFMKSWAAEFRPQLLPLFEGREAYLIRILELGRSGEKPRKDLIFARQIFEFIRYFYPEHFRVEDAPPDNVSPEDEVRILEAYLASYDHRDDQSLWFDKIRTIAEDCGYAPKPKDYKKNPDRYKGHVGDVSTVIRIAVMGRSQSPDVWEIQQILGEEAVRSRIGSRLKSVENSQ